MKNTFSLQGQDFRTPKGAPVITPEGKRSPFVLSASNSATGVVTPNIFGQISLTVPFDCRLFDASFSVQGLNAAALNIPVPMMFVNLTQPSPNNVGTITVGTHQRELNFVSNQQYFRFEPSNGLFVSSATTIAISFTLRFPANLIITDAFSFYFVGCFI